MDKPSMTLSAVVLLIYTGQYMVYPFLPLYVLRKGGSPLDVGLAFLVNLLLASLLSVPMGRFSDRYGRRKTITLGCTLSLLGYALIPLLDDPLLIIAAFSLAGIGHAAYGPTIQALVGDFASPGSIATAFGIIQTVRQSTTSIGPAIGGFMGLLDLRYVFVSAAVFNFAAIPVIASALKSAVGSGDKSSEKASNSKPLELLSILKNTHLLLAVSSTFAVGYATMALRSFLPLYIESMGGDTAVIGLVFTAQAIISALVRIPIARYADATGKRETLMVFGMFLAALSSLVMTLVQSIGYITIMLMLFTFFLSFGGVIPWVIVAERAPPSLRGVAMGMNNAMLYAGQGVGSAFTGLIIHGLGFGVGFASVSVVLLAIDIAYVALMIRHRIS